jgi:hypothetical protein
MLENKINLIITSFAVILFSITAFYYIFNDIVKNIKRNKNIKIRKAKMEEERLCERNKIVPPSLFKIKNKYNVEFSIDLDNVIGFSFESGKYICFNTATNDRNYIISLEDLNFIENTEELEFNNEFKILTEEFSFPYYNSPTPESKLSKCVEFENLYNQLLKWKALRKLYLTAGIKASIYDYKFYSLIKNIKFIDVIESNVCKTLHQQIYKIRTNSTYGISNLDNKQKEKKNEKLIYVEDN